jgi:hypothetical protein
MGWPNKNRTGVAPNPLRFWIIGLVGLLLVAAFVADRLV